MFSMVRGSMAKTGPLTAGQAMGEHTSGGEPLEEGRGLCWPGHGPQLKVRPGGQGATLGGQICMRKTSAGHIQIGQKPEKWGGCNLGRGGQDCTEGACGGQVGTRIQGGTRISSAHHVDSNTNCKCIPNINIARHINH